MGSDRAKDATLVNIDVSEIRFPGNQADCLKCHAPNTYVLPLPSTVIATGPINQDGKPVNSGVVVNGIAQPISMACAGCHAGQPGFEAHALTNTSATLGEACANCHGKGKEFDVQTVH
jgi:OmcA/MtrC family decaheme c-type cytochrome